MSVVLSTRWFILHMVVLMTLIGYFIEIRNILLQVHPTRIATGGHLHKYHLQHIWYGRNGVARLREWLCKRLFDSPTSYHAALSCRSQVRLLLNGAPFSLSPICKADKKTGACILEDFVKGTEGIRSVKWGDATWNSTCGNPGF